ncbi:MAG: cytochrome b/b6 domain-containing protein [Lysobacterales bacterium]|jgi:thiosulfate reductase cytochrome b subunit
MNNPEPIHEHIDTKRRIYLHPMPVRIWHWANALGFVLLILTGLQIRYADIFKVISFETSVQLHNWIGFIIIINWFLWFFYYMTSDKITNYLPDFNASDFIKRYFEQAQYYGYGIFVGEERPHDVQPYDKFNPMQKLTYQFVMLITVPITFFSGLMMWNVDYFAGLIEFAGGIRVVNTVHVIMFIIFVFFIFLHAYMGMLGSKWWSHYKEMFTGYEEPHD